MVDLYSGWEGVSEAPAWQAEAQLAGAVVEVVVVAVGGDADVGSGVDLDVDVAALEMCLRWF